MPIFYKSKLAKFVNKKFNIDTFSLGTFIFTCKESLSKRSIAHHQTHNQQFMDCMGIGLISSLLSVFLICGIFHPEPAILLIFTISPFVYPLWYLIEWSIKYFKYKDAYTAYYNINFEKQARFQEDQIELHCSEREDYKSFDWMKF